MSSAASVASAVVVGAGVFGASIADHLAGAGWDVELVEQYQPGHVRQSSGGASRLIRYSHGPDAVHSAMAWRSRDMWHELERDSGEDLLIPSGVVWFTTGSEWVADSARTLADLGIPARILDPAEVSRLFPSIETGDLVGALHEPDAGVLKAANAVRALVARAQRRGARLTLAEALPTEDGGGVTIDGELRQADIVVWACGPWLPEVFPDLVDVAVTKQDVLFYGVDASWSAPAVPGWVDYEAAMYGCGDLDGLGFKASSDVDGEPFDPDTGSRLPSPVNIDRCRAYVGHRFPALADAFSLSRSKARLPAIVSVPPSTVTSSDSASIPAASHRTTRLAPRSNTSTRGSQAPERPLGASKRRSRSRTRSKGSNRTRLLMSSSMCEMSTL